MQGRKDAVTGKLQLSLHLMVDKGKLVDPTSPRSNVVEKPKVEERERELRSRGKRSRERGRRGR